MLLIFSTFLLHVYFLFYSTHNQHYHLTTLKYIIVQGQEISQSEIFFSSSSAKVHLIALSPPSSTRAVSKWTDRLKKCMLKLSAEWNISQMKNLTSLGSTHGHQLCHAKEERRMNF